MWKKALALLMLIVLAFVCHTPAYALPITIKASATNVQAGNTITITGTAADADMWVSIKGVDSSGNLVYFNAVLADASGNYRDTLKVPDINGTLTIIAGSGTNTSKAVVQIDSSGGSPSSGRSDGDVSNVMISEKPTIPETGASCSFALYIVSLFVLAF